MSELFAPGDLASFDPHSSATFNYRGFLAVSMATLRHAQTPTHSSVMPGVNDGERGSLHIPPDRRGHGHSDIAGGAGGAGNSPAPSYTPTSTDYDALLDTLRSGGDPDRRPRRRPSRQPDASNKNGGKFVGAFIVLVVVIVAVASNASPDRKASNRASTDDRRAWAAINNDSMEDLEAYLRRYPSGAYAAPARAQLQALTEMRLLDELAEAGNLAGLRALADRVSGPARVRASEAVNFVTALDNGYDALASWMRTNRSSHYVDMANRKAGALLIDRYRELAFATESDADWNPALPGPAWVVDVPDAEATGEALTLNIESGTSTKVTIGRLPRSSDGKLVVRINGWRTPLAGLAGAETPGDASVVIFRRVVARGEILQAVNYGVNATVSLHMVRLNGRNAESIGMWSEQWDLPATISYNDQGNRYYRDAHRNLRPYARWRADSGAYVYVPAFWSAQHTQLARLRLR
ncbi:MAG: hypothetical protein AB7K09_26025 [Planctomycetota bacterium]